jgi:hypothetical protein
VACWWWLWWWCCCYCRQGSLLGADSSLAYIDFCCYLAAYACEACDIARRDLLCPLATKMCQPWHVLVQQQEMGSRCFPKLQRGNVRSTRFCSSMPPRPSGVSTLEHTVQSECGPLLDSNGTDSGLEKIPTLEAHQLMTAEGFNGK